MEEKQPSCQSCKATDGLQANSRYTNRHGQVFTYYLCRACNTIRANQYRNQRGGMAVIYANNQRYEKRHPERRKAWTAAQAVPLAPCSVCGTDKHVHRHHPDPLKQLDVVMLCALHHKQAHRQAELVKFVTDPATIAKAVEGSMDKRLAVIDKAAA